jgi:plastocyanin
MRISSFLCCASIAALTACGGGAGGQIPGSSNLPLTSGGTNAAPTNGHPSATSTSWNAQAGGDRQQGALQALAFFPRTITIDAGDSVTWTVQGEVHTITFLPQGSNVPPGDPTVPQGPNPATYDGTNFISSGILPPGQTYTVKFTAPGTYTYRCFLHLPEMTGTVIVKPAGTSYPHPQGFYTGTGMSDLNAILSDAMTAVKEIPFAVNGLTVAAGAAPGGPNAPPSNATVLRFLNGDRLNLTSVTVPLNATVTWVNWSNNEPHTVTFPVAGQPLPPALEDPFSPPSGIVAGGVNIYDGTQVTNSGPIGTAVGFPTNSYSLKFTKRGTFVYFCLFHDEFGMMGTVIVK